MPVAPRRRTKTFEQFWHGLPWNGLFWAMVLTLSGMAAFFAVQSERELEALIGVRIAETAEIAPGEPVTAVLILNGDEFVVEKGTARAKVRMIGIKSFDPVVNEREITAYGDASVRFLQTWIINKQITLQYDEPVKDAQGRYLAYVYLGDIDVNRRMIAEGVSMVYTEYETAREREYLMAELEPRATAVGIWGGRKSRERILGLRREWANARAERSGQVPLDPLLEETAPP